MDEPAEYAITLAELQRSARVPWDEQVTEQGDPPPPPPIAAQDLDRQRLLGILSAGVL